MSEDLANEIEAINSIYGENTIASNTDVSIYILAIPNHDVFLRLRFPAGYPASPPLIEGTETVGAGTRKGDGQSIVNHARETLMQIYTPGQVCLFDLLEELPSHLKFTGKDQEAVGTRREGDDTEGEAGEAGDEDACGKNKPKRSRIPSAPPFVASASALEPKWHLSNLTNVKKSFFLARATRTHSPAHAAACIEQLLASDKRAAKATHNISAYRIRSTTSPSCPSPAVAPPTPAAREVDEPNGFSEIVYQDFDDDGETAAGGRLLRQMQMMGVWDVLVVVSRWYGGVKLGPARFGIICGVAREALVEGGWSVGGGRGG